jgi:hypothetical protein
MFSLGVVKRKTGIALRLRLFFLRFHFRPWAKYKTEDEMVEKVQKRGRSMSAKRMVRLAKSLYRSVRVKRLIVEMDTGDFPLNAQLIPLEMWLSRGNRQITINFENRNSLDIIIETRPIKVLWNYIFKT